jgi:DNA-binding response OmpR family regulator
MSTSSPRIIIVDPQQKLYHLVRAAMELMERRPRLIETYNGDDALMELRAIPPDLLITSQTLREASSGTVLALMAKREMAALPVIVVGEEDDPELDDETIAQSPFQYLRRPMAPEAFIRALRIALDGPEAAPRDAAPEEIIPVPPLEYNGQIQRILFELMRNVNAMAVILADRNGKVIGYDGAAGYVDRDLFAAALAPGFGNTIKMLPALGGQPRVLKYYDAERSTVFGLSLGLHHFVILVYDRAAPPAALGNVKRFGATAINQLLEIVGPVAFDPKPSSPALYAKPDAHAKRKTRTQELRAVQAQVAPSKPTADKPAMPTNLASPRPAPTQPVASFDPSVLDALDSVDLAQAEALFDPDKLAESTIALSPESRMTFDDALMQGIIGEIEE